MRQIIALGGGGLYEARESLIRSVYLDQSRKPNPKICYVPTATGDSDICIKWFYDFFEKHNASLHIYHYLNRLQEI
ncbi:peptidase S51-like protein [Cytobacillus oceanisediminis]|uniref:Peptidase S51-like protein n=1 Tax=Cytobacillus oceanisediminis TaxID=665099 RepID=A0A2V3A7M8_9BACI|nr:peptidase S51-like protein [Cytobacillus oceanisediminis]